MVAKEELRKQDPLFAEIHVPVNLSRLSTAAKGDPLMRYCDHLIDPSALSCLEIIVDTRKGLVDCQTG